MDRSRPTRRSRPRSLSPRERGWTAAAIDSQSAMIRCPRASGDGPRARARMRAHSSVVPARAGMDRGTATPTVRRSRLSPRERGWTAAGQITERTMTRCPRASGDGPIGNVGSMLVAALSPRERGWTVHRNGPSWASWRCPRASGDGPLFQGGVNVICLLSPRERGWTG